MGEVLESLSETLPKEVEEQLESMYDNCNRRRWSIELALILHSDPSLLLIARSKVIDSNLTPISKVREELFTRSKWNKRSFMQSSTQEAKIISSRQA